MKNAARRPTAGKRPWTTSVVGATVIVVAAAVVSATVNPLLGRAIHWDWMAGLAAVLFVGLALSFRNRWL